MESDATIFDMERKKRAASLFVLVLFLSPVTALAGEFGGQTSIVWPCFNAAILAVVGPPRGGIYIWTPATKTFNGPPSRPGQWLLGLTGGPYICLLVPVPVYVLPGISITMMGSS